VGNRSGAHGAGLYRHVEIAIDQSVVAHYQPSFAQSLHFRVRRRVVVRYRAVATPSHDVAFAHHNRSHRHLAERQSTLRFAQRLLHEEFIRVRHEGEG